MLTLISPTQLTPLTLFICVWEDLAPPSDADVWATLAWTFRIHTWFMIMPFWHSPAVFPPQSLPAAVIAVLLSSYQTGSVRESEKITGKRFKTQWHRRNGELESDAFPLCSFVNLAKCIFLFSKLLMYVYNIKLVLYFLDIQLVSAAVRF